MAVHTKAENTLVVIGGGAAGFFCAVNAARMNPSLHVIIVEKSAKILSKVKVSGGGRCNVTNACCEISTLIRNYPRGKNFLKKAFHWFNTVDTVRWFEERGVVLKEEPDGRMFPVTNSSQTVIDCLLREADRYHVEVLLNKQVEQIVVERQNQQSFALKKRFRILFSDSGLVDSDFVCVACGGYPKSVQFDWLRNTGHTIVQPVPSLFTFNIPLDNITSLMGVVVNPARVKIPAIKLEEAGPVLITHWGLSGPAVLKLSAWGARDLSAMNYDFDLSVNWTPEYNENNIRSKLIEMRTRYKSQKLINSHPFNLPARIWIYLVKLSSINEEQRWSDISASQLNNLIKNVVGQTFRVKGKTTFKEEFVTCGGVSLSEIDVNTMESKILSGLYFAGEIMDVDGVTGGFNFQHAWTSGFIAAKAISSLT